MQGTVQRGESAFLADQLAQDAACYLLIKVAEATKDIPAEVREQHPDISWRSIMGMRNRLAHQYVGVNTDMVWRSISENLPAMIRELGWLES